MGPQRIFTYDAVWGLKRMFYHIERFKLPVPIKVTELLIFVIFEVMFIIDMANANVFGFLPPIIRFLFIPLGASFILSRLDIEGRPPYRIIQSIIIHYFDHKHWSRGLPIQEEEKEETHKMTRLVGGIRDYATSSYRDS
ncbi:TcpE family conjugal transfer membrane protein [Risungbinella massiliensis]|uniref:TcpE family conjugal transfer membrane protein n=1 Tax=Risungbinella massiliensis TaxID=1329796 RepID=UPI0005CB8E8B|nr:TcpE family conjugal transfer membrane protein [Risungbinella massiliensis]